MSGSLRNSNSPILEISLNSIQSSFSSVRLQAVLSSPLDRNISSCAYRLRSFALYHLDWGTYRLYAQNAISKELACHPTPSPSPTWTFFAPLTHLFLVVKVGRYSLRHRSQNRCATECTCRQRCLGVTLLSYVTQGDKLLEALPMRK